MSTLAQRFRQLPVPGPAERLVLRRGTGRDYDSLARFHYRHGRPAVPTRVFVLDDPDRGEPVGILIESMPLLRCHLRDRATGGRYAPAQRGTGFQPVNHGQDARATLQLLNAEVRCIARIVIDPRWRGLGLGIRLVRHALDSATTPVTEALAAMGHAHPLFELAGMTPTKPDGDGPVYYLHTNASTAPAGAHGCSHGWSESASATRGERVPKSFFFSFRSSPGGAIESLVRPAGAEKQKEQKDAGDPCPTGCGRPGRPSPVATTVRPCRG